MEWAVKEWNPAELSQRRRMINIRSMSADVRREEDRHRFANAVAIRDMDSSRLYGADTGLIKGL